MTEDTSSPDYRTLADQLAVELDRDKLLTLALLEAPVGRNEALAIACTELVRKLDPDNPRAIILAAYQSLNYWLDDSHVDESIRDLLALLQKGEAEIGATGILLEELTSWRSRNRRRGTNLEYLLKSIDAEPTWVTNHFLMGLALLKEGRKTEANSEFETSVSNLLGAELQLDAQQEAYEICFTGRLGSRDALLEVIESATGR